jgi:hypothetical protein
MTDAFIRLYFVPATHHPPTTNIFHNGRSD